MEKFSAVKTHRHIVTPLRIMPIQSLPRLILRHNPIQRIAHIRAHILVPILVQAQRAARVLHEQVQQPDLVVFDFRQRRHHVVGDKVRAAGLGGQRDGFLRPAHCRRERRCGCA